MYVLIYSFIGIILKCCLFRAWLLASTCFTTLEQCFDLLICCCIVEASINIIVLCGLLVVRM